MGVVAAAEADPARVWVDQDRCTGDGLCVQYAPEVFEFDIDGLAYVKDAGGSLLTGPGARTDVPDHLRLEVVDAARECPGECIHVERAADHSPAGEQSRAAGQPREGDPSGVTADRSAPR